VANAKLGCVCVYIFVLCVVQVSSKLQTVESLMSGTEETSTPEESDLPRAGLAGLFFFWLWQVVMSLFVRWL